MVSSGTLFGTNILSDKVILVQFVFDWDSMMAEEITTMLLEQGFTSLPSSISFLPHPTDEDLLLHLFYFVSFK